jgi:LAO/AO transport system kinase
VADELTDRLRRSAAVSETQEAVRAEVLDGRLSAGEAADLLLAAFDSDSAHSREERTGR